MSPARQRASVAGGDRAIAAAAALLALAFAGAQFPGPFALLDNLSNFPAHFGGAFLACAAVFAWRRRLAHALASAALAAAALAPVLPWYFEPEPVPADTARPWVRLLVANVQYANPEHGRLLALVREQEPDLVGLVEVSSAWLRSLEPLRNAYPHHYEVPDERYVGLALYSRFPLENPRTLSLPDPDSSPAIAASLAAPGGNVELVLAHPTSPVSAENIARRNAQVAAIARYAGAARDPLVLAGDLNLTMWNDAYRPLVELAQLRNARKGHGIGPTWPSFGPVGVPIDHILGSPGVYLRNFRVLSGIGSDHRPVMAEFSVR